MDPGPTDSHLPFKGSTEGIQLPAYEPWGTEHLQRALWVALFCPCLRGLNGWGAVGTQRSLSIIYPTVHQADVRGSTTLTNPYGVLLSIHTPASTDLAMNQTLSGCFQTSPHPSNPCPVCGSSSLMVFPTSGHPQLDGVAQVKAIFHRPLFPSLLLCPSFIP